MFIRFLIKILDSLTVKYYNSFKIFNFENQVFLFLGGFFPSLLVCSLLLLLFLIFLTCLFVF